MEPKNLHQKLTRREILSLLGGVAAAATAAACTNGDGSASKATSTAPRTGGRVIKPTVAPTPASLSCVVSPEMTEGPYFVDEMLNRSDITSDPSDGSVSPGVPLRLVVNVQQLNDVACTPIAGALVDVWHCDAEGTYSDVAGSEGRKFLRGYQLTDAGGNVEFKTIYPGWYTGRAVHIHMKVRTGPNSQSGFEFTSQLFFDDATTDRVYAQAPYNTRGTPDTMNAADSIYGSGGSDMLLELSTEGSGYVGRASVGVQMT